jgi:glycosyltransferase involved in cell wall biosynthesis
VRILLLVPYEGIRGPLPKVVPLLAAALSRSGCDVATERWSRHADEESFLRRATGRFADLLRIRARLRREPFDAFFVTTAHDWPALVRDVPLLLATRRLCPGVVVQFHGSSSDRLVAPGSRWLKAATRVLLRRCDAVLVLSNEERDEWSTFFPKGRFEVVANAFRPSPAADGRAGTALAESGPPAPGGDGADPVILFVGRLMVQKGIFELLDAMAQVRATTRCRLVIAGDGPARAEAQDRIAALGLTGSVALAGYLAGADLDSAYRAADIFVLPSYSEGFPTVLLEAMSEGLPIVTTRLRGAIDLLRHEENVLFVPPRSAGQLADALLRLLGDPELRAAMAANNREKVKEFAPDVVARRYVAVLESVVHKKTAHTR